MSITLTPLLDLLLSLVCLYYGLLLLRDKYDLIGNGYFMVCSAAFIGFFDLGGLHSFRWIHDFLSAVSRLIGTLAMGLGIISLLLSHRKQRLSAYFLTVFGYVATFYFYVIYRAPLEGLYLWAGVIFLLSVLALALRLWQRGRVKHAVLSILALMLTAVVGLFSHSLPKDLFLKPVDIFHLSLMFSYIAIYYSVAAYAADRG